MGKAARQPATYDDVMNAPPNKVAEIIDDELILSPRPAGPHSSAKSVLMAELGPPFYARTRRSRWLDHSSRAGAPFR
jgi:hypothetical protein